MVGLEPGHTACFPHRRALSVVMDDTLSRYCQKCRAFHPVEEYDGRKR
jgi:hypothetical protein